MEDEFSKSLKNSMAAVRRAFYVTSGTAGIDKPFFDSLPQLAKNMPMNPIRILMLKFFFISSKLQLSYYRLSDKIQI